MTHLFYSRSSEICKRFKLAAELDWAPFSRARARGLEIECASLNWGIHVPATFALQNASYKWKKRSNVRYYSACTCERVNVMTDEWFE